MDVVYRRGGATAAEIQRSFPIRPCAAAVRTMLRILEEKGHLRHEKDGPRHVYYPDDAAQRRAEVGGAPPDRHVLRRFARRGRRRAARRIRPAALGAKSASRSRARSSGCGPREIDAMLDARAAACLAPPIARARSRSVYTVVAAGDRAAAASRSSPRSRCGARRAEARALVWRSAVVALLVVLVGRQLPLHWLAWVGAVGRSRRRSSRSGACRSPMLALVASRDAEATVAAPIALRQIAVRRVRRRRGRRAGADARCVDSRARRALRERRALTTTRWTRCSTMRARARHPPRRSAVRSPTTRRPDDVGFCGPSSCFRRGVERGATTQRRMVLLHELAHVRAADWALQPRGARRVRPVLVPSRRVVDRARTARRLRAGVRRSRDRRRASAERLRRAARARRRSAAPARRARGVALALARRGGCARDSPRSLDAATRRRVRSPADGRPSPTVVDARASPVR